MTTALLRELSFHRRKEAASAAAHFVTGVLDREAMVNMFEELCATAEFKTGDRVKTLRGSTRGVIVKILDDGRIVWRPAGTKSELIALPESLLREE